ncbi:MAG: hypothetical protein ABJM75_01975 [Luteolibacter sp.]
MVTLPEAPSPVFADHLVESGDLTGASRPEMSEGLRDTSVNDSLQGDHHYTTTR